MVVTPFSRLQEYITEAVLGMHVYNNQITRSSKNHFITLGVHPFTMIEPR